LWGRYVFFRTEYFFGKSEVALARAAIILAAGKGVRMHSPLPKVLHPICGRPLVHHVIEAVKGVGVDRIVVVVGYGREAVEGAIQAAGVETAVQDNPLGTADAVRAGLTALEGEQGGVLVVPGDTPLVDAGLLASLVDRQEKSGRPGTVLTFTPEKAGRYGRILRGDDGSVERIVEAKDASEAETAVGEVNTGMYGFDLSALREVLPRIGADNRAGEYYLTDVVELFGAGRMGAMKAPDPKTVMGINTPAELTEASTIMRERIIERLMAGGVAFLDPASTYVEVGVEIGEGTTVMPFTVIHEGVRIGKDCIVGPFAHLREGTEVGDGAWVGAFVELKKTRLGEGTNAGHLIYLGDAEVGDGVTVGGGVITANFDGREKPRTIVGKGATLGVGTRLVAPVRVGSGAVTGAGAVVTSGKDVGAGDIVVGVPARPLSKKPEARGARK
jgi:bifunctional UDP-N-acetylglucosamine pyrophosphorylase/glucosamine-1-phosphate N-acetyltransferase